ncbi:hypothetical protein ACWDUX_30340 [Streptomyces sp. NPDC003444]
MGALRNATKRRARRAVENELRLASEIHRARLARDQNVQLATMSRPGGYYAKPLPDEAEKDQAAYVDRKGRRVEITPENAGDVSRFATARPAKAHTKLLPMDSSPSSVVPVPTGDESRRTRDLKARKVVVVNAITPPRRPRPRTGPQVHEWGIGA